MNVFSVTESAASDWSAVPSVPLKPCRWSPNPPPEATAQIVWSAERLLVRLDCFRAPERSENTAPDSAVWEDSCLEFFFSFGGENYVNLEGNANGALRASVGPDRHSRRFLRELSLPLPRASAESRADGWSLTLEVPAGLIEGLYGETLRPGLCFRGNFYACGDQTPAPYYAGWNCVETETPDFHRPEYFGELVLSEA